jgi:hypothetical protein
MIDTKWETTTPTEVGFTPEMADSGYSFCHD